MDRIFFMLGSLLAAVGVMAGAFGAHALKGKISPEMIEIFRTGVLYQLIHALAVLAVAWATTRWPRAAANAAGWLFVTGIILFSGSLYGLSLGGPKWLGPITPLGGLCFIAGWLMLAWAVWKEK